MTIFRFLAALLVAALVLPAPALGCIWDFDTVLQERSRFPDALELVTGKFLRHSTEFYQWRIKNRLARLKNDPDSLDLLDDLAVAYEKTGQHDRAIELMLQSAKKRPARYETEANLGTFYIHAGQWQKGLVHIDNALRINPAAHFGRERYQRWLVEYVVEHQDRNQLPLQTSALKSDKPEQATTDFVDFLGQKHPDEWNSEQAIHGILGMMRFGNYDSPILLEALGDLLRGSFFMGRGKQLATRAYLKASYAVSDQKAKGDYRKLAQRALTSVTRYPTPYMTVSVEDIENDFRRELADAAQWYDQVREDERSWIRGGMDVDEEFVRKYYREPAVSASWGDRVRTFIPEPIYFLWDIVLGGVGLMICLALWNRITRKRLWARKGGQKRCQDPFSLYGKRVLTPFLALSLHVAFLDALRYHR